MAWATPKSPVLGTKATCTDDPVGHDSQTCSRPKDLMLDFRSGSHEHHMTYEQHSNPKSPDASGRMGRQPFSKEFRYL